MGRVARGRFALAALALALSSSCALPSCTAEQPAVREFTLDTVAGSPRRSSTPSPLVRGPLPPAEYFTERFRPALRMTVPDGWRLFAESEGALNFSHGEGVEEVNVIISRSSEVVQWVDPFDVGAPAEEFRPVYRRVTQPAAEQLAQLSEVEVTPAGPLTFAGGSVPAFVAKSLIPGEPGPLCSEARPCINVPLASHHLGLTWGLSPSESVILATAHDANLTVMVGGFLPVLRTRPVAEELLGSIRLVET